MSIYVCIYKYLFIYSYINKAFSYTKMHFYLYKTMLLVTCVHKYLFIYLWINMEWSFAYVSSCNNYLYVHVHLYQYLYMSPIGKNEGGRERDRDRDRASEELVRTDLLIYFCRHAYLFIHCMCMYMYINLQMFISSNYVSKNTCMNNCIEIYLNEYSYGYFYI